MGRYVSLAMAIIVFICGCSAQKPIQTASPQPAPMQPTTEPKAPARWLAHSPPKPLTAFVQESEVIVVATMLDYAVAPNLPSEWRVRFHVDRIIKGKIASEVVVLQMPYDPKNFPPSQKTWILLLNHEFLTGTWPYGAMWNERYEDEVKGIMTTQGA